MSNYPPGMTDYDWKYVNGDHLIADESEIEDLITEPDWERS